MARQIGELSGKHSYRLHSYILVAHELGECLALDTQTFHVKEKYKSDLLTCTGVGQENPMSLMTRSEWEDSAGRKLLQLVAIFTHVFP